MYVIYLELLQFNLFFKEPKSRGKFKILESGNDMTTQRIVERIIEHRLVVYTHYFLNSKKLFPCVTKQVGKNFIIVF